MVKAVYLAFFQIDKSKTVKVGALGEIEFEPGNYVYVGSAMNNVEKRLERHFNNTKNKHWHIDYFSAEAEPLDYFILPESSDFECLMAEQLSGFCESVRAFGCSDCSCSSHLFRFD